MLQPNDEGIEVSVDSLKAAKMKFRFGHMENALEIAGEPDATITAIQNGTYSDTMDVVERMEESNSTGHC